MSGQPPGEAPLPARSRTLGLVALGLGIAAAPLDTTVNVAFPALSDAFSIPITQIQWVIIPFALSQTSLGIAFGKLGDRLGHRRIFVAGLVLVALALAGCALATSYGMLIAMRVAQGLATGLLIATGPAIASFLHPPQEQRRAMAAYTALFAVGLASGPLLGGVLIDAFGWPAVFWVRVPIALAGLLLFVLQPGLGNSDEARSARSSLAGKALDWRGALLLALGLVALVMTINLLRVPGHGAWLTLPAAAVTAWLALAFVRTEARAEDPVFAPDWLRSKPFRDLQLASIAINFATFANLLLLPYLLADWATLSLGRVGLILACFPIGTGLASVYTARVGWRGPPRRLCATGLALAAVTLAGIGGFCLYPRVALLLPLLAACGFGLGLFQIGHLESTMANLPAHARGVAGSLAGVTRLIGLMLSAILLPWLQTGLTGPLSLPGAQAASFFVCAAILLIAVPVILHRPLTKR
ncbi:MAG: MFS transporter [Burkholderiaceae bacterium]